MKSQESVADHSLGGMTSQPKFSTDGKAYHVPDGELLKATEMSCTGVMGASLKRVTLQHDCRQVCTVRASSTGWP